MLLWGPFMTHKVMEVSDSVVLIGNPCMLMFIFHKVVGVCSEFFIFFLVDCVYQTDGNIFFICWCFANLTVF